MIELYNLYIGEVIENSEILIGEAALEGKSKSYIEFMNKTHRDLIIAHGTGFLSCLMMMGKITVKEFEDNLSELNERK